MTGVAAYQHEITGHGYCRYLQVGKGERFAFPFKASAEAAAYIRGLAVKTKYCHRRQENFLKIVEMSAGLAALPGSVDDFADGDCRDYVTSLDPKDPSKCVCGNAVKRVNRNLKYILKNSRTSIEGGLSGAA